MPAWIKVESTLRRHRKVIRLGKYLGLTDERIIVGGLVLLWLSVRESAPDGNIAGWNAIEVACAAGFEDSDADRFYLGLHECGFLEGENGTVRLHDWMEHNGDFLWCNSNPERQRAAGRARAAQASRDSTGKYLPASPAGPAMAGVAGPAASGAGAGAGAVQESKSTPLSDAGAPDGSVDLPPALKRDPQKQANAKDWLAGFAEFWKAYPPRANSSRKQAVKVWVRLQPKDYATADDHFTAILAALEESKAAWQRDRTDEAHLPHHSVWLNKELWSNHADQP